MNSYTIINCYHGVTTFQPDEVAKKLVDDSLSGVWSSTVGLEGFMLTTLCAGMGPITDAASFVAQVGCVCCVPVYCNHTVQCLSQN